MPAKDPIYSDMTHDFRLRCAEQKRRTPRAFALREEVIAHFRALPFGDRREPMAELTLEMLNLVVERGTDIDPTEERSTRQLLDLPPAGITA